MCCVTKGTHGPELQSRTSKTRRDTGGSNVNLVGPVSPGTKQPTRKADPRSAHTRSTFQPQNSTSQSINLVVCRRQVATMIVSLICKSSSRHAEPPVPTQTVWACELSIYGLCPGSPGRSRPEDLAQKKCVSKAPAGIFVLLFPPSDLEQRVALCAGGCREKRKEACRKMRNVWAKVLADERPFCSQRI